jgi:hypothetical protein
LVEEGGSVAEVPGEDKENSPPLFPDSPAMNQYSFAVIQYHFIKGRRRYKSAQTI